MPSDLSENDDDPDYVPTSDDDDDNSDIDNGGDDDSCDDSDDGECKSVVDASEAVDELPSTSSAVARSQKGTAFDKKPNDLFENDDDPDYVPTNDDDGDNDDNDGGGGGDSCDESAGGECRSVVDASEAADKLPSTSIAVARSQKGTAFDKKPYCYYCGVPQSQIQRHWLCKHGSEKDVIEIERCKDAVNKRKLIARLRNVGNHHHNTDVLRKGRG